MKEKKISCKRVRGKVCRLVKDNIVCKKIKMRICVQK